MIGWTGGTPVESTRHSTGATTGGQTLKGSTRQSTCQRGELATGLAVVHPSAPQPTRVRAARKAEPLGSAPCQASQAVGADIDRGSDS